MKTSRSFFIFYFFVFVLASFTCGCSQSYKPLWPEVVNITQAVDTIAPEMSGLYWNPVTNCLYCACDQGIVYILRFDIGTKKFKRLAKFEDCGHPEGITQVNDTAKEFYTMDENSYEIRRYKYDLTTMKAEMHHKWRLTNAPILMPDTGNEGPEGIAFVPDSALKASNFLSSESSQPYQSKNGMGGLLFVASQNKGFVWVVDVNPHKNKEIDFVGKYKTGRKESCDLCFDRTSGLLYILHNIDGNFLEVTDLSVSIRKKYAHLNQIEEFPVPRKEGNDNVEGFAMMPEFGNNKEVSAWLCRDVGVTEPVELQKNSLWWLCPFMPQHTLKKIEQGKLNFKNDQLKAEKENGKVKEKKKNKN